MASARGSLDEIIRRFSAYPEYVNSSFMICESSLRAAFGSPIRSTVREKVANASVEQDFDASLAGCQSID